MTLTQDVEIAVIGAGVAGIATAYYLCTAYEKKSVLLIDSRQALSFTSAQSGDNYRNWWPHPTMVNFTNDSIDLMERIARESSNVLKMTRRGYAVATRRANIDELLRELVAGYGGEESDLIRVHGGPSSTTYQPTISAAWTHTPDGVDVLSNQDLIRQTFPSFNHEISNVVHIRRAGEIDSQQMAEHMLQRIKEAGGKLTVGNVTNIEYNQNFMLDIDRANGMARIDADIVVNAAGPFAKKVAAMIGVDLPIENIFQQKVAFDDRYAAVPRQQAFSIDLDDNELDWTAEERELLADDQDMAWLSGPMPGGIHCRPEGGTQGSWVKLGWAYNRQASEPQQELKSDRYFDPHFPEIVLRGAASLNPALKKYNGSFPGRRIHYGGYYSMTRENWPLIGPMGGNGAFVVGALSGFGSMSACAAGALCAAWISAGDLPDYAMHLSLERYNNQKLLSALRSAANKGVL
ncbi:MAG: NAD(P)/FAD-dependent oxidoreductase [Pseudomonadales bacterium]